MTGVRHMGLKYFRLKEFDELKVLANLKTAPVIFIGENEISRLKHFISGMSYALDISGSPGSFVYVGEFEIWYMLNAEGAGTKGTCMHMLERCLGDERAAFDMFFREFEKYLKEHHGTELPDIEEITE